MADVKCPMCAKPNRSDADVCEFCGARITPVTAPLEPIRPGETPTPKRTSDLEQTLPGWLRDVRKATNQEDDFSTEQEPDASQEAPFEMGIPSFLESAPQPQADDLPAMPLDLLAGLTAGSDDEDEETPDWLKNLRADTPDPAPDPAETAAGTDLQDLLASLDPRQEKPPTPSQQPASESWGFDEQKFDFSDDARDDSSFDALESPDWLAALKSDSDQALAQTPESSENMDVIPGQEGDLPAWLQDMAVSDNASPASPQPASPINQPESTLSPDDTPDWLAALSADATPAPAAAGAGAGDTPDWLAALSADETPIPAESPLPAAAGAGDTPDWLAALSADETPIPAESPL
ncbi:MAG: hypothetical protein RBS68_14485, partial [Anaerolineales bacterium]|nr:hypothetical protein [Anaerolineales bacterium]